MNRYPEHVRSFVYNQLYLSQRIVNCVWMNGQSSWSVVQYVILRFSSHLLRISPFARESAKSMPVVRQARPVFTKDVQSCFFSVIIWFEPWSSDTEVHQIFGTAQLPQVSVLNVLDDKLTRRVVWKAWTPWQIWPSASYGTKRFFSEFFVASWSFMVCN